MDSFFLIVTWFGSLYVLVPLSLLVGMLLAGTGRPGQAVLLGLGMATTILFVHAAKLIIRRPRPEVTELLIAMPSDWSFPSAHSAQATAFFLSLAFVAFRILPTFWALVVTFSGFLIVAAVGYSRIHLQVHFVSDVLAGVAMAAILTLVVQVVIPFLPRFQGKFPPH